MNEKNLTKNINTPTEPTRLFKKRIGSVIYETTIAFNPNAKETLNSKLKRLIMSERSAV